MDSADRRYFRHASPACRRAHVKYLVSSGSIAVSAHPRAYRAETFNACNLAAFIGRGQVGRTAWKTIFWSARYQSREV